MEFSVGMVIRYGLGSRLVKSRGRNRIKQRGKTTHCEGKDTDGGCPREYSLV